jgi:hypothetical protein
MHSKACSWQYAGMRRGVKADPTRLLATAAAVKATAGVALQGQGRGTASATAAAAAIAVDDHTRRQHCFVHMLAL